MTGLPLIPRAALFGNPSRHQARISPDGKWLTWLAPFEGVLNVWLAPADDVGAAEPLTRVTGRPIAWQDWACDGAHILFLSDESGDENWRVFAINRTTGAVRNLTPISRVSARILMVSPERPDTILIGLNDRDPKWHDVWAVDLATAERRLVLENSEFWNFAFDWQLHPRVARKAEPAQGGSQLYRLIDETWEPWLRIPHADELTTWPLFYNRAGNALTMMSSLGRNRAALIRVDENAGTQTLLAEHAKVDLGDTRISNPMTFEIDAIAANYLRQEWIVLNPAIQSDLRFLRNNLNNVDFMVDSQSNDNDRWIVTAYGPKQPLSYFLYDRRRQVLSSLFSARPELAGYRLAPMQSQVVQARDGLDLVSDLTLPAETQGSRPDRASAHGADCARWSLGPRRLRLPSGSPVAGKPRLCGAVRELSRLDRLWKGFHRRRDARTRRQNARRSDRCGGMGGARGYRASRQDRDYGHILWRIRDPGRPDIHAGGLLLRRQHRRHFQPRDDAGKHA